MKRKIVLSLLIQCAILFQAVGSLSETNSAASWDRHVRKERLINAAPDRSSAFLNHDVRYVILILSESGGVECTGTILAPRIIITAAHCILNCGNCSVESGGRRSSSSKIHNIVVKHVYENYDKDSMKNDLALLVIDEPIDVIHSYHRAIQLHDVPLPPNSRGLVTGWGTISKRYPREYPSQALSMSVDILSLQQCQHAFSTDPNIIITSNEICTFYFNRNKCCWFGDSGAPLVVNDRLVGVFSWFELTGNPRYPDVFMNLLHPDYKWWVQRWVSHFRGRYPI